MTKVILPRGVRHQLGPSTAPVGHSKSDTARECQGVTYDLCDELVIALWDEATDGTIDSTSETQQECDREFHATTLQ